MLLGWVGGGGVAEALCACVAFKKTKEMCLSRVRESSFHFLSLHKVCRGALRPGRWPFYYRARQAS
jgi:hypothetical protein